MVRKSLLVGVCCLCMLGASVWLAGCGGGHLCCSGEGPSATLLLVRSNQTGRVVLPAASSVIPSQLTVGTSAGSATVAPSAEFACPTFLGGLQLAVVFSPSGKPMLMGWLDETHTEISAQSTAEVLLYYALAGQWLPGEQKSNLVGLLRGRSEALPLVAVIASAVAADPDALFDGRASVAAELRAAKSALIGSASPAAPARHRGRDVLIDPSNSRSGLTLQQDGGAVNSIYLVNRYRRRSYAFVDRVSYTIAGVGSDVTMPSPASVAGFDVEPVGGVSTVLGTITDMFYGNMAYQEKPSAPVQLTLTPDTAKKTTYEVTVVGWGREPGDFARLTAGQKDKYGEMVARSLVCDFFLPLLLNAIIPAGGNKIDDLCNYTSANAALKDFVGALTQNVPGIWQKAESGDMEGAVWDAYQAVQNSDFLKPVLLQLIMNSIKDSGQALAFGEIAQKFLNVLTAGDAFLTGFDALVQSSHYAMANRADVWKVDVTTPNLRLQPDPAVVTAGLDTDIAVWGLGGTPGSLDFLWSTTGAHGHLEDGRGNSGTQFQSSQSTIRYVADSSAKDGDEDTVRVSVRIKQNLQYVEIGKAEGSVFVVDVKRDVAILPADAWCWPKETKGLYVSVLPSMPGNGQVTYDWASTSTRGVLKSATGQAAPFTTDSSYVTYEAGDSPGSDTATVTAWMKNSAGKRIPIGTASATVEIRDPNASTRKIAFIDSDWTLIQTTPPFKWFAAMGVFAVWKIDPNASGYLITVTKNGVQQPPFYRASNLLLRADYIGHGCKDDEGGVFLGGYSFVREQSDQDTVPQKPPAEWWTNEAAQHMGEYNEALGATVTVVAQ